MKVNHKYHQYVSAEREDEEHAGEGVRNSHHHTHMGTLSRKGICPGHMAPCPERESRAGGLSVSPENEDSLEQVTYSTPKLWQVHDNDIFRKQTLTIIGTREGLELTSA